MSKLKSKTNTSRYPKIRKLFGGNGITDLTLKQAPQFYANSKFVVELKADDFDENKVINQSFDGIPGLIMWYADWCPHCSSVETQRLWNYIAEFCSPDVCVGAVNCNDSFNGNDELAQSLNINGYPSITYVNVDGTIDSQTFHGERNKNNIVEFICDKVTQPGQLKICK